MAEAAIFADSRESVSHEAGDFLLAQGEGVINPVRAELGDLLTGTAPGRADDEEITVFESLGLAAEDLAAASYLYEKATRLSARHPRRLLAAPCPFSCRLLAPFRFPSSPPSSARRLLPAAFCPPTASPARPCLGSPPRLARAARPSPGLCALPPARRLTPHAPEYINSPRWPPVVPAPSP